MMEEIGPIQIRVKELHQKPQYVIEALNSGAKQCKAIAKEVMDEVREKVGIKPSF